MDDSQDIEISTFQIFKSDRTVYFMELDQYSDFILTLILSLLNMTART
jgi:hypothetical protein